MFHQSAYKSSSQSKETHSTSGNNGAYLVDNRSQPLQTKLTNPSTPISGNDGGVIQRKVKDGDAPLPKSYHQTKKTGYIGRVNAILEQFGADIGDEFDHKYLEGLWNKLMNSKTVYQLSDTKAILAGLQASHRRTQKSQARYKRSSRQAERLTAPLIFMDDQLVLKPGARNPKLEHASPLAPSYSELDRSGSRRLSTYASSLMMELHPSGEEFQGSRRQDGRGMMLSSNVNSVNGIIQQQLQIAAHLKTMAAEFLIGKGVHEMPRDRVMADRVLRHVSKLYSRISTFLAKDAPIHTPANVQGELDGLHAEIRIVDSPIWDQNEWDVPTGTKYPCLGCFLYLNGEKIEIGHFHGALWVTNAAMTKQLEAALLKGRKIGSLTREDIEQTSRKMSGTYAKLPKESRFAMGQQRDGKPTDLHDADSDSDMSESIFASMQERLSARSKGVPSSPLWKGMGEWSPPMRRDHPVLPTVDELDGPMKGRRIEFVHGGTYISPFNSVKGGLHVPRKRTMGLGSGDFAPDEVTMNGETYTRAVAGIRDGGQCLWDTLRRAGFTDLQLTSAALTAGLEVDKHVYLDQVTNLLDKLSEQTGINVEAQVSEFNILTMLPIGTKSYGKSGGAIIKIGFGHDDINGHFVPPSS